MSKQFKMTSRKKMLEIYKSKVFFLKIIFEITCGIDLFTRDKINFEQECMRNSSLLEKCEFWNDIKGIIIES